MKKLGVLLFAIICGCGIAVAQSNEIAATVGGQFVTGTDVTFGHSGVVIVNPAHRLLNAHVAALYVEVPLTWTFDNTRDLPGVFTNDHYSSFFVTPGLKLKLLPQLPISPYGFLGTGLARFHDTDTGAISNNFTYDYGAGLDWKVLPLLSVRGEIRDYNSGVPGLGLPVIGGRQQNLMATVGLNLHF